MNIKELISNGAAKKAELDKLKKELAEINIKIAKQVKPLSGSKTGRAMGIGFEVVVTFGEKITYDQSRIETIIESGKFPMIKECFKIERKPIKKMIDSYCASIQDFHKAIDWARTTVPATPSVKYERIDDDIPF